MFRLDLIIGTRPDIIRCSVLIRKLREHPEIKFRLIHTGQHYDNELNKIFFEELNLSHPDIILSSGGFHPCEQHSILIKQLFDFYSANYIPDACILWGDTYSTIGFIVPLRLNIPIIHGEGGMRSFNLEMPEERNRVIIDRVSDVLYCYHENYKINLVREGINPSKIVVTGNTIVDVLNEYKKQINDVEAKALSTFGLKPKKYALQTLHRDEHMNSEGISILLNIDTWAEQHNLNVILPLMPRLEKLLPSDLRGRLKQYIFTKPMGFFDFIALEKNALIEFTDSGTNQETSAIQGTPCLVTRTCTERPETFDSGISTMGETNISSLADDLLENMRPNSKFSMGNGNAADIIIEDLLNRFANPSYNMPFVDPFIARHFGV